MLSLVGTGVEARVPDGSCAIIVASRANMTEVQLFEQENPQLTVTEVYEAPNGWLAISIGSVALQESDQRLEDLKRRGTVPPDSYCSRGESYIREVSRGGPAGPEPVSPIDTRLAALFDARPMSIDETRFLQSGLAYLGYYAGILDGEWGRRSQEALDNFSFDLTGGEATNGDAALLMMVTQEKYEQEGWQYRHFPEYGVSLFLPVHGLETSGSEYDLSLEHFETGLYVYLTRTNAADATAIHLGAEARHDGSSDLYRLREPPRWVTAATWEGQARYVRSESVGGLWTSVTVSAPPAPQSPVNVVVGSITLGPPPAMRLPAGGYARRQIAAVYDLIAPSAPEPAPAPPAASPSPEPNRVASAGSEIFGSGTAFYFDAEGHALTNAHVVEGCRSVSMADAPARVLAVNEQNDLAVLEPVTPQAEYSYLVFGSVQAVLNSDVTVAGYPLQPILGGLNVTRGAVSSLTGIQGDITTMQITAPVQPGNSGGPVVNRDGRVVGVVVAKIALEVALERFGSVPENVNFAIRSDIAKLFLTANGFSFEEEAERRELAPEDLAGELQQATVLVECVQ